MPAHPNLSTVKNTWSQIKTLFIYRLVKKNKIKPGLLYEEIQYFEVFPYTVGDETLVAPLGNNHMRT